MAESLARGEGEGGVAVEAVARRVVAQGRLFGGGHGRGDGRRVHGLEFADEAEDVVELGLEGGGFRVEEGDAGEGGDVADVEPVCVFGELHGAKPFGKRETEDF